MQKGDRVKYKKFNWEGKIENLKSAYISFKSSKKTLDILWDGNSECSPTPIEDIIIK